MLKWLKRRAEKRAALQAAREIDQFTSTLSSSPLGEVAYIALSANHCRNMIERDYGWNLDYPDVVGTEGSRQIPVVVLYQLLHESQKYQAFKLGFTVWLLTVRSTLWPEARESGRRMWRQLERGIPHVVKTANELRAKHGANLSTDGYQRIPIYLEPLPPAEPLVQPPSGHWQ